MRFAKPGQALFAQISCHGPWPLLLRRLSDKTVFRLVKLLLNKRTVSIIAKAAAPKAIPKPVDVTGTTMLLPSAPPLFVQPLSPSPACAGIVQSADLNTQALFWQPIAGEYCHDGHVD